MAPDPLARSSPGGTLVLNGLATELERACADFDHSLWSAARAAPAAMATPAAAALTFLALATVASWRC